MVIYLHDKEPLHTFSSRVERIANDIKRLGTSTL